jgi:hypothetical protein
MLSLLTIQIYSHLIVIVYLCLLLYAEIVFFLFWCAFSTKCNNNLYERDHIHILGVSSPICKRHLESTLNGIKSYLCLVQTCHVDIEEDFIIKLTAMI